MAVAGLHNVSSAFGPSFFGDSRPTSRASSLLQMWKELENEHVMSGRSYNIRSNRQTRNGSDTDCSSTPKYENGDDDIYRYSNEFDCEENNSIISEDLGEAERERARQIFQEWMRSGSKGNPSCRFRLNSRSDECERVREGSVAIRPIRKLCGRQTLLDLLQRAQSERKRELLCLHERRPVSEFVHRNRIQALLRGRFLRNEKPVLDERPSSRAATELGLLRLRPTVSDLREGFLSKLDNSSSNSLNSAELNSSFSHGSNVESESTREEEEAAKIHKTLNLDSGSTNTQTEANNEDMSCALSGQDLTIAHEYEAVNYNRYNELLDENYEEPDPREASDQVESSHESVMEIEDDGSRDDEEGYAYAEPFENNNIEDQADQIQESHVDWPSHDLQEAIDSWLDIIPSRIRIDTFYPPNYDDDDSAGNMELRELFSRRRVSTLLGSGFRESLNQVLQSHVERLARVSSDQEPDDVSLTEGDQEQISLSDETSVLSDGAERNPFAVPTTFWDEEFRGPNNWSHHKSDYSIQLETEWQLINELRIEMARLHQRMNNMQSMLEACMEIQIELQRSVLQKVSAALNRSARDEEVEDASDENQLHDKTHWDNVRKGICCLCRDGKIDSLLYRCGHMCACSKCADNLVRRKGKCPMCCTPVVEVVRAYFIQ